MCPAPRRTVNTASAEYTGFFIPYSVLCILVYPVGVNALYVVLLWWNRSEIRSEKKCTVDGKAAGKAVGDGGKTMISFLHRPYSPTYFWWEPVDSVSDAACSNRNTILVIIPDRCLSLFADSTCVIGRSAGIDRTAQPSLGGCFGHFGGLPRNTTRV